MPQIIMITVKYFQSMDHFEPDEIKVFVNIFLSSLINFVIVSNKYMADLAASHMTLTTCAICALLGSTSDNSA